MLTQAQIDSYHQDGYVQIPGMFNQAEIDLLYGVATDDSVVNNSFDLNDQNGKKTKLTLWFTAGDDSFGLMSRCARLVQGVQSLLGPGEVCHFHSKVMQKEPRVGGAWEWHQDYGYWYKNGFLYPEDMISVMVALTDATIENGCLQVLKGTHKMQRIEHHFAGEQQGADMDFVQEAEKVSDLIVLIHQGTVIAQGTIQELQAQSGNNSSLEKIFAQLTSNDTMGHAASDLIQAIHP